MSQLEEAVKECRRIEENADHSAQGLFVSAGWWGITNNVLLIVAGVAGAAAGGLATLDEWTWSVPWLGLISAVLCAILLAIQPGERARAARAGAVEYQHFRNRARQTAEVRLAAPASAPEVARLIDDLEERRVDIAAVAPSPGWLAYLRARKMIEDGRTTNNVDHGTDRDRRRDPDGP